MCISRKLCFISIASKFSSLGFDRIIATEETHWRLLRGFRVARRAAVRRRVTPSKVRIDFMVSAPSLLRRIISSTFRWGRPCWAWDQA